MLGGGQLGRMTLLAAHEMGIKFWVINEQENCPCQGIADTLLSGSYFSEEILEYFATHISTATYEFENIPIESIEYLENQDVTFHPNSTILKICQNRALEKQFLQQQKIPHAPFRLIHSAEQLQTALTEIPHPTILKTLSGGYDGKGQIPLNTQENTPTIWKNFPHNQAILESKIPFAKECSIITARDKYGHSTCFPLSENTHRDHILHFTLTPASVTPTQAKQASDLALHIADALELIGILAVELFLTQTGHWLVNELAPRPHNSGHWTLQGCATSQFHQHLRTVAELPLGSTDLLTPSLMLNLIGEHYTNALDLKNILKHPKTSLHLYGKTTPHPKRKMGHITFTHPSLEENLHQARTLFPQENLPKTL